MLTLTHAAGPESETVQPPNACRGSEKASTVWPSPCRHLASVGRMSFDLAVWRRAPSAKTAMIVEVYDRLGERDHPAAGMFDTHEFIAAAGERYGLLPDSSEGVTWIGISDDAGERAGVSMSAWTGRTSAVVHVSGPFPWLKPTIMSLRPLVCARNLMLYDPQDQAVYNNRRRYPEIHTER